MLVPKGVVIFNKRKCTLKMQKIFMCVTVFLCFVAFGEASNFLENYKLPPFLKICRQSDPDLSECVRKSVEQLKPLLVKGIPEFNIPSLEPLFIPEMIIQQGSGGVFLKSTYTDIKVYGPSKFNLKSIKIDLDKDRVRIKLFLPHLRVQSQYNMEGRILMMPIAGKGESCGNYSNVDATVTMQAQRMNKDGETYFHIKDFYVDFVLGHASIHLQNLFNGDKKLGDAMNVFINDNWKNVSNEIKPIMEDTIAGVFKKLANKIFHKYPIDVLLPE